MNSHFLVASVYRGLPTRVCNLYCIADLCFLLQLAHCVESLDWQNQKILRRPIAQFFAQALRFLKTENICTSGVLRPGQNSTINMCSYIDHSHFGGLSAKGRLPSSTTNHILKQNQSPFRLLCAVVLKCCLLQNSNTASFIPVGALLANLLIWSPVIGPSINHAMKEKIFTFHLLKRTSLLLDGIFLKGLAHLVTWLAASKAWLAVVSVGNYVVSITSIKSNQQVKPPGWLLSAYE